MDDSLLGLQLIPSPSPLPCHTSLSRNFFSCLLLDLHFVESYSLIMGFLSGSVVKILPATQETWVQLLGQQDPLEEGMAAHSSILAGKNPVDRGGWRASHGAAKSQTWLKRPSRCSIHSLLLLIPSFSDAIAFVSPGSISISFHHLNWPSLASSDGLWLQSKQAWCLWVAHTQELRHLKCIMAKGSENSWLPVTAGSGRVTHIESSVLRQTSSWDHHSICLEESLSSQGKWNDDGELMHVSRELS